MLKFECVMKKRVILLFVLFASISVYAQQLQPSISFLNLEHDFGTINEDDGPQTYSFEFTNTGSQPLIINNVNASCGCTTPSWSKVPVMPGGKGYIEAMYDPKNRPGVFNKTVTVYISMLIAFVISYIICVILFNIRCNFLRYKDDTVRKQRCFCITFVFFVSIFIFIELSRKKL